MSLWEDRARKVKLFFEPRFCPWGLAQIRQFFPVPKPSSSTVGLPATLIYFFLSSKSQCQSFTCSFGVEACIHVSRDTRLNVGWRRKWLTSLTKLNDSRLGLKKKFKFNRSPSWVTQSRLELIQAWNKGNNSPNTNKLWVRKSFSCPTSGIFHYY